MGQIIAKTTKVPSVETLKIQSGGLMLMALIVIGASGLSAGNYALEVGFQFLLLLIMAEAWNLMAGYTGLVSLGTASFVGIGGYTLVGLMNRFDASLSVAVFAAGIAAMVLALLVSRAVFRMRGLYFTVGTLALAEALRMFMVNSDYFGGATGIFLAKDSPSLKALFWMAFGVLVLTTMLMQIGTQGRFSVLLRAVRDDEDAAAQAGVRAFRVKLGVFALSSFLIGLAGGLQALKLGVIEPYGMFGLQWTVNVLTVVIIGGQGKRFGSLVGAVLVVALSEALADYPAVHLLLMGFALIVIIRFAPQGLAGLLERTFNRRAQGGVK
ncbi:MULTISPECIES: branched-chain amino acid ABC transporter permease [Pseudomonas]|jgi:branched-chain amino acid transport system permease protein|uniref:branched-chain amino acid ABC transporter permease n=1 Tax=Pseudomonas TaxID=286 RepID=UPI000FC2BF3D